MMKINYNKLLILGAITLFLGACDFLDKEPQQSLSTETALLFVEDAEAALVGAYDAISGSGYYGRDYIAAGDIAADNAKISPVNAGRFVTDYNYSKGASNNSLGNVWDDAYECIAYSNNIINGIGNITNGTDSQRNRIEGEALFLRALSHFDLVRIYAQDYKYTADASHLGVPYVTVTEFAQPVRNTVKEVIDNVIADLIRAEMLTIEDNAPYSASSWAVKALLARVYQYKGDWGNAYTQSESVINDGSFSLVPNAGYVDAWTQPSTSESIFNIANLPTDFALTDALGYLYLELGYGDLLPTQDLLDLYSSADTRRNLFITGASGQLYVNKFPGRSGQLGLDDFQILRLSEMYLISAEATAEGGGGSLTTGAGRLNEIRTRANLGDATPGSLGELLTETLVEKRREFAFEGHRLHDIKRRQQSLVRSDCNLLNNCTVSYPNDKFPYPIPQFEINANSNMVQNVGYN